MVVVPQYIIFNKLDLVDTLVPLIVPKFLATEAFFVFLMVQFMRGLPRELDEAAGIDGCGPWRIFYRVMLPLTGPALDHHGDLHLHLDLERFLHTVDLPDRIRSPTQSRSRCAGSWTRPLAATGAPCSPCRSSP